MQNATRRVQGTNAGVKAGPPRHVSNELIVKVKPGADIDAIAKSVGAIVIGRDEQAGHLPAAIRQRGGYGGGAGEVEIQQRHRGGGLQLLLRPADEAAARWPMRQQTQTKLTLDDSKPNDPCHPIVAVIDTQVQSLGSDRDKFVMKPCQLWTALSAKRADAWHGHGERSVGCDCTIIGRAQRCEDITNRGFLRLRRADDLRGMSRKVCRRR